MISVVTELISDPKTASGFAWTMKRDYPGKINNGMGGSYCQYRLQSAGVLCSPRPEKFFHGKTS